MSYKFKTRLSDPRNYGEKRDPSSISYIVIHYTGNDGDSDEGNGNFFANNKVQASAHFFVDSDSVTQGVPDNYVAWSVGGSKYASCASTGGGTLYGKCKNANSISIELCDDKKDGKIYPSEATIENALELVRKLMKQYNIPASKVIRHFDVTGKLCPAYWCGTDARDKKWKTEFKNKIADAAEDLEEKKEKAFLVKIKADAINVRSGAGTDKCATMLVYRNEVYTITETKKAEGLEWGRLKSGAGWICLYYTEKV